ncbi:MAG: lytic transglycosylase domain-containing protein [Pseudomonadota bacterium]
MRPHPLIAVAVVIVLLYPALSAAASTSADLTRKLKMAGYRSSEIQDVISGRKSLGEIKTNIRRKLLGLGPAPAAPRRHPKGLTGGMIAAKPYLVAVRTASRRHGVTAALILAVIQAESAFIATAVSRRGAVGLMQLMPGTADALGVRNAFDPLENISGGTRYLSYCLTRFGSTVLALAAYNAGPESVTAHAGIPPWAETHQYVQRVLAYERYFRQQIGPM